MNRAERRARDSWIRFDATDPIEVMRGHLVRLTEAYAALAHTTDIADARAGLGVLTEAERAAVSRWAVPAGEAFARAASEISRLDARLRQIVGSERRGNPAC